MDAEIPDGGVPDGASPDGGPVDAGAVDACAPGAELCNGADEDCDGVADNGYNLGDPCSVGTGSCARIGTIVCGPGLMESSCSATPGTPSSELCNGADDNCDGSVDEDFPAKGDPCVLGQGQCQVAGSFTCTTDGMGVECPVTPGDPSPEICDGVDNDCDGTPDDGNPGGGGACVTGMSGVCEAGTITCLGVQGLVCLQDEVAGTEVCDGVDNDCDGTPDDGNPGGGGACVSGMLGVCEAGTITCLGVQGLVCLPNEMAGPEVCDGLDNDCDGTPDDGLPGCILP